MAKIYKIKRLSDNKLSKQIYKLKLAREIKKDLEAQGVECEIVVYKDNVEILDFGDSDIVKFFREL